MKKTPIPIPDCFVDFFRFQDDCADGLPSSGLTFDMLPGISRDVVSAWTDSGKHINADELATTAVIRAIQQVTQKLTGSLSAMGVEMNECPETVDACTISDRLAPPAVAGFRGIRIVMRDKSSRYSCFRVDSVTVKTCSAENVTLQIRNQDNVIVWSQGVTTFPGAAKVIPVNQNFDTQILYIGFDQQGVAVYESDCRRSGPCCMSQKWGGRSSLIFVDGWDGTYQTASHVCASGYGVAACVSVVCKRDNLLCELKDQLKWPLLYAVGVEMLREAKAARRINPEMIMLSDNVDNDITEWMRSCDDGIASQLNTIKTCLLKDKVCFACCKRVPSHITSTS